MFNGLNNKLANVPTISGLSNVVADDVITNNLILDGVDIGTQVAANTQTLTGITYTSATDTTTVDNNLTITALKTLTAKSIELTTGGSILSNALTITDVELGYLDGVTSNIQTQFNTTVKTTGAQSITGIKTFTTLPESSVVPTTADQLTNKTYVDSVAGAALTVAVADTNAGINYYPVFTSTGAGQKALLFDITTTPFSYLPSTGTLTVSAYDIRATTTPSTISGSGLNVTYKNNNENGLQQFIVSTGLGPVTMIEMGEFYFTTYVISDFNSELRFRSAASAKRSITNTFYNLNDTSAVAGGAAQGRIYSDTANTYIEGFVGNHSIIGTENSTVSARQLFNFGSSSANLYSPNLTLNGTTNFNVGQGSGDTTNVIIGVGAPRTIIYNATSRNTMVGFNSGSSLVTVTAAQNTFVGALAGEFSSNGSNNTFVGVAAGSRNNNGIENTFIGVSSGYNTGGASAGAGSKNTCVGFQSGFGMITTSTQNTLVGHKAGSGITTAGDNVCIGYQSGFQTGAAGTGGSNVCVGNFSGDSMTTTASANTLIGTSAGTAITSGSNNTLVGNDSGIGITSSANNVFIGHKSGFQTGALGTGNNNTCVGMFSGDSMITSANGNTTYGYNSGTAITTGANNTIIGSSNATTLTTGSNNIVIGNGANVLTAAAANVIAIGTSSTTMFIQGGFNHNIGVSTLTFSITLTAPLAQFYSVTMGSAAQVITLPTPTTASVKGAYVVFKRRTNTTHAFTIGAGAASMIPVNSITAAATVSIGTATFNCELICDGTYWNVIQQS